ncbi:jg8028 [Pararge aegeria aegeria]|uniref:Jg8028 protein n=1 Tax=Pararge aegeria aegeria TaxID=348720 RepID=A0A8S4RHF0_9NEOP|nr:jg8028 [Pararge aegeria aegeria]
MEKAMLGKSLRDQIRHEEIRIKSRVMALPSELRSGAHSSENIEGRWGPKVLEWRTRTECQQFPKQVCPPVVEKITLSVAVQERIE